MLFVGDDWAEDHHDVYLMNDAGEKLASRRLPEGLAGMRVLHELVAAHAEEPAQVIIGIETDRGLWVDALDRGRLSGVRGQSAGGSPLPRPPPRLGSQVRCRRSQAPGRSGAHRSAQPPPDRRRQRRAEAVKVLARAHQNLIWARNRHTNALRTALREYYPAALETFEDLADRDALAILGRAPTPARQNG